MGLLSGSAIAFPNRSVDRSLSIRLTALIDICGHIMELTLEEV
jgi:hypothetical protein